jgi:hypothetical protein
MSRINIRRPLAGLLFLLKIIPIQADGNDTFDRIVRITTPKGTVYELLKDLSVQSGYSFVYDSRIIDNDRKVKIPRGEYTLREAIHLITGNLPLRLDLLGGHILLRLPPSVPGGKPAADDTSAEAPVPLPFFTIEGAFTDSESGKPIPYVAVGIQNTTLGTIANRDGTFRLTLPDSLRQHRMRFSHIGYESMEPELTLLKDAARFDFTLKPQPVPLREIIVQYIPPAQLLKEMLDHRPLNYPFTPVCQTSFYREGITHRRKNIDLTESVLQIYKTGYDRDATGDQIKLIKKRRFVHRQKTDTIFPKMRSGINSCLVLDIMKELPEFIGPDGASAYAYTDRGITAVDGRKVHIIRFRQRNHVKEPLYRGEIYIEKESKALVEIRFEINPLLAGKATHMFVDKKSAGLKINLQHARYIVSYKPTAEGIYHIRHIRGDIEFKVRHRKRLFATPLNFWFEMVTCRIETENVHPFPRNERLSPTRVFAETKHNYDKNFWENFNILLPEEELKEDLIRNLNEILITE